MVGHSDFHIDIAVVDPYNPEKYLMGILLDGEGYRQTSNTRDREVAQIGVLMNLGWVLHRIWTIDWWDNRERELKKLVALLEKLKAESRKKHEAEIGSEKEKAAAVAKREAEARALKAELEKQAAEVIADDDSTLIRHFKQRMVGDLFNVLVLHHGKELILVHERNRLSCGQKLRKHFHNGHILALLSKPQSSFTSDKSAADHDNLLSNFLSFKD